MCVYFLINNNEKFILVQNTINVSRYQTKELRNISLEIENSESESNALEIEMYKKLCKKIINETENLNSVSKKIAFSALKMIKYGKIIVTDYDDRKYVFGDDESLVVIVKINKSNFSKKILKVFFSL